MLMDLKVSNFAIIENLHLSFGGGLNIISGETGAGKSILLKGLGLLMGQKGSSEQIRTGQSSAAIEGVFDLSQRPDVKARLEEMGLPMEDETLVVRRTVSEEKSKVYMNGSLCTLSQLREIIAPLVEVTSGAAPLIEMTGQHDSRQLLSKSYHLDIIDYYGGLSELRAAYSENYATLKEVRAKMSTLKNLSGSQERELDFLKYQRDEILAFDPNPGDESNLEAEIKRVKSAKKINAFLNLAEEALSQDDSSVLNVLQRIVNRGEELRELAPEIGEALQSLALAKEQIEDALFRMERRAVNLDESEAQLEFLEDRLSRFRKLQKKYGASVDEIIAKLMSFETEIARLSDVEGEVARLETQAQKLTEQLLEKGDRLHQRRAQAAKMFSQTVNDELLELNMKGLRFTVFMERRRESSGELELTPTGVTELEFCTQVSSKDTPKPISKFASGGELSRILLSIKSVGGKGAHPRTYLFDEVDTGVSGETAEKVGRKLRNISKGQQVICVTHLPQVAMFADHHYLISKTPDAAGVRMTVTELDLKARTREIARLVSGEKLTDASLKHAEELIQNCR